MGFLRTYLALLVVLGHVSAFDPGLATPLGNGAVLAVKSFFLLSGFYMSLVLDTKYGQRTLDFYKSRALRLYPLYWATCLAVLAQAFVPSETSVFAANLLRKLSSLDSAWLQAWVFFSNLTFFGSDLLAFAYCCKPDGSLVALFPELAPAGARSLQGHLIVLPSWTLGIEAVFYVAAPFLFRSAWRGILLLLAISVTSRMFLFGVGYNDYVWARGFVLSEAVYFALGMASYRLYRQIPAGYFTRGNNWLAAATIFSWTTILTVIYIRNVNLGDRQIWETLYHWTFMGLLVGTVPFLFELSRRSRADFLAGELSYPIYITHVPTIVFLLPLFKGTMLGWPFLGKLLFCIGVVVAVALLGIALVSYPVEVLRGRRTMQARHAPALPA